MGALTLGFRRELIPASLLVYRIANFGALEFSTAAIWERRPGETETKVGTVKEVTVWEQRDGVWLVARHVSYAHEPVNPK